MMTKCLMMGVINEVNRSATLYYVRIIMIMLFTMSTFAPCSIVKWRPLLSLPVPLRLRPPVYPRV